MTVHRVTFWITIIFACGVVSVQAQQKSKAPQFEQGFSPVQQSTTADYAPSFGRLSLQFGSGIFIGAGGGVLGGLAGMAFVPNEDNSASGFANMGAFVLGGYVSYTVFSSLGIYIIANNPSYDASFGTILLGNVLGAGAGLGGLVLMGQSSPGIGAVFAFAFPVVGGMIANNLSIDKRPTNSTALLNISEDHTALSTPSMELTRVGNAIAPANAYSPTVELINISL